MRKELGGDSLDKKRQIMIWVCWLILSPIFLMLAYNISPPIHVASDLTAFLILMCLVSFWPVIINGSPIFYVQGVSLVVFLYYGLFVEILLTQIAVIVLLVKVRISSKEHYRYPLNSLMFYLISFGGAGVYYFLGGTNGRLTFYEHLLPIIAYGFTVFIINQLLLSTLKTIINKVKFKLHTSNFLWEFFTSLLVFPFAIVLYFLYLDIGMKAIFVVGTPLLGLSVILSLYYKSQQTNHYLQQASEIGHQLTGNLQMSEVLDIYMEKVTNMFPIEVAYIIDVEDEQLSVIRKYKDGKIQLDIPAEKKFTDKGISGHVYTQRESVLFQNREQWKSIKHSQLPKSVESVIGVPVIRNQALVGIVILASNKKRAFDRAQLMIIDLLSTYLGVAVENAKNYKITKKHSEHCPLTGLYNYRYIEQKLEREFHLLQQNERNGLSLLLLDIDYFKAINDTYGHHAGNEVLIQFSQRLLSLVGKKGTVARYGGEEFVILLPNIDKQASIEFAEEIRHNIADKPFEIEHSLQTNNKNTSSVFLTVSIGVASAPEDGADSITLIRLADRAMYIGAKKAGRNKVAGYVG